MGLDAQFRSIQFRVSLILLRKNRRSDVMIVVVMVLIAKGRNANEVIVVIMG